MKRVRVLIIDDSALARQILQAGLSQDPEIEVVGTATDPYHARDRIQELLPDVLTLDVEMPHMDGVEFLRKLMPQFPLPVVMVSSLTQRGKQITFDALEAGAVDFVPKPTSDLSRKLGTVMEELRAKVKAAAHAKVSRFRQPRPPAPDRSALHSALSESTDKIIAIGASTGGTEALARVLSELPAGTPGVVVVQHMPSGFTALFAERLARECAMEVKEAATGDRIRTGRILVAAGGTQLRVRRSGGVYLAICEGEDRVSGHCPSVDVLMKSVAEHAGSNAVGILLTGMGQDGAEGLLAMRRAGARTLAQDEATCVVYGMPKVAFEMGAVERVLPLGSIASSLLALLAGILG